MKAMKTMTQVVLFSTFAASTVPCFAESESEKYCNDYLSNIRKVEKVTGMSVAIEQKGKLLYEFTEGNAKIFSKETPLEVASITKIMTATLMVRLMEDGKLSLYDNVRQFIPEFPFDDVLVLHVMTHTSGLRQTKGSFVKQKELFYKGMIRTFPLDTDFQYFSAGYNILGDIIERISGMALEDYAKKIIFDPLAMKNTAFSPHLGESGMRTTAGDLLKFSRHILDIRKTGKAGILKQCSVDLMFRDHTRGRYDRSPVFFLKSETRRFGRYFGDLNSPSSVGHAGSTGCFLLLDPQYDLSIVILTNGSKTIQSSDENFNRINSLLTAQFAGQ